jgi:hypothetical protein
MTSTVCSRLLLGALWGILLVFLYALADELLLGPACGTLVPHTEGKGRQ